MLHALHDMRREAQLRLQILSAHRLRCGVKIRPNELKDAEGIVEILGVSIRRAVQSTFQNELND
jgi:hypothetical protein